MARLDPLFSEREGESPDLQQRVAEANEFFQRYESCIRSIIDYVARDQDGAEDLYQDFYLSIVKKPLPDGIEDVEGYLYRTLVNRVRGQRRKAVRYRESLRRYAGVQDDQTVQNDVAEDVAKVEEANALLDVAQKVLGRREYEAIRMRYYEGHGRTDVGKRLGLKSNTISRYIWAGIEKLRRSPAFDERG